MDSDTSINVWNDPWIKGSSTFKPSTLVVDGSQSPTVANLWLPSQNRWNSNFLHVVLNAYDVQLITGMVLPYHSVEDQLI